MWVRVRVRVRVARTNFVVGCPIREVLGFAHLPSRCCLDAALMRLDAVVVWCLHASMVGFVLLRDWASLVLSFCVFGFRPCVCLSVSGVVWCLSFIQDGFHSLGVAAPVSGAHVFTFGAGHAGESPAWVVHGSGSFVRFGRIEGAGIRRRTVGACVSNRFCWPGAAVARYVLRADALDGLAHSSGGAAGVAQVESVA